MTTQEKFKIECIIELLKEQEPDRIDLITYLEKIEQKEWFRQAYVRFVSGFKPNEPNSEWQFEENIELEHPTEGIIVLDVLKDGRIGGIDFLKLYLIINRMKVYGKCKSCKNEIGYRTDANTHLEFAIQDGETKTLNCKN